MGSILNMTVKTKEGGVVIRWKTTKRKHQGARDFGLKADRVIKY